MDAEKEFEYQLSVFGTECEQASQFFYAFRSMHEVAARDDHAAQLLNNNSLFWNTVAGALQMSALITLGRVFDQGTPYNLDKVLHIARNNPEIFSMESLGRRKQGDRLDMPDWLNEYLRTAYAPTAADFRRLKRYIRDYRRIYEKNYRDLRNLVYAHKMASGPDEIRPLVAKTNVREMERLFVFLLKLHAALWQLFFNGRKPVLRPLPWSAKRMNRLADTREHARGVQERIIKETRAVLTA